MTTWTNTSKNSSSYSDQTKNSSSYSNVSKTVYNGSFLLMANGFSLLKADGGKIILAQSVSGYIPTWSMVTKN